jgi:hypothetical protein
MDGLFVVLAVGDDGDDRYWWVADSMEAAEKDALTMARGVWRNVRVARIVATVKPVFKVVPTGEPSPGFPDGGGLTG